MIKILVINPVGTNLWDKSDKEYLSKFLSKGFQLDVRSLKYGPHSLESSFDVVLASPFIVEEVKKAEVEGYKAIIINCFLNPAIEAAREITNIPVVGPGEASIYLACMLGEKFSILGIGGTVGSKDYIKLVRSLGLLDRLASVRTIELPVLELDRDREKTFNLLVEAGRRAIEEDDADVLILGCTGLAGDAEDLQKELIVPVIEPALAALK
ncbi:hypothetical protein DRP05_15220, partial [Archaeoglobales archaeon]